MENMRILRLLFSIEDDLNAAGSYIEDLDQWVAKPGQQETLNNLLYEQRLAWKQQAESVNQTYTKGDQIEAATAASFGDGLDQFDTNTKISVYKLFGLDVPDYLLVKSPLAIKNEKTLEDASGALKTISGVSKFAGYAIPGMVTDMLLPAGAVSELGKVSKILYTAVRNVPNATAAGGSAYKQAKREGKSDEEASAYSLLNTAANLAYGTFFEGLGMKEGNTAGQNATITKVKKGIDKAVSKVIRNPNTVKTIAALSKNMGEAAAQTYLQEAIDPLLRNATLGEANTIADLWKHATSAETITNVLQSAVIAGGTQLGSMGVNRTVSKVAGEGGLLNEANLKNLSDSDVQKVGDAITNAYAETAKADPNLHVTDAQIEAYKKQSKKNMGSKENAIAQILIKTDELKGMIGDWIERGNATVAEGIKRNGKTAQQIGQGKFLNSNKINRLIGDKDNDTINTTKNSKVTTQSSEPQFKTVAEKELASDLEIGRSLGAKAKNYDILDSDTGEIYHFEEGSRIQNIEVFAGKGTHKPLKEEVMDGLSEQFGGNPKDWEHVKGFGIISIEGKPVEAEVHWFQESSVGKVKFKIKRWIE